VIPRAGSPRAGQHQQRRDDREEEEDVIEIHGLSDVIRYNVTRSKWIDASTL
jgi:hypothetical protein